VDIKLTKDELAIVAWIYGRTRAFGKTGKSQYWANVMKKELGLSQERYQRAVSFLREMGLAATEHGKVDKPEKEDGDWIFLTGQGANLYRHLVKDEEWDIAAEKLEQFWK
jgi:hypothetical protein